ncbi:uncharacterized protein LOC131313919 [Rhododendron vialii]|uniref:uncharacterized protein LOC131313919 n=1 Tax=Rhododendron vialii TaxID=182163 RepID=UPI0026600622|nr:uncharacterized protein LOC131313919 [Rhododendron vialii]
MGYLWDIEFFVSHPDVENDDEEELGWERVPPGFEHDDVEEEEEELGGAGNGNEEEVQNIRWEGGQCGDDDIDKGASGDDDTDNDGDNDGACSGLRDSSSSYGDDIEDVVNQGDEGPLTVRKAVDGLGKYVIIGEVDEESDCSDDNCSVVSSLDEEEVKKKVKYPEFNEDRDMKNPKLVQSMLFPNVRVLRTFLKEFHWASTKWLAKKYVEEINDDPNWKVKAMQNDVRRKWMLDVSKIQIYRAKRKALEMVEGAHGEQYHRL